MTNKTVSLVLGSGGARGLAHIGVIRWLEDNGYDIRSISGCSMGALVGGIHACGKLDVFEQWVRELSTLRIIDLLDVAWGKQGLVEGERIITVLKDLIGDRLIEDLPIEYTAVAVNIMNEKEVWLKQGSLFSAIRASISLPLFFAPMELNGMKLLDGGILNPVPVEPTHEDDTDLTIAVNLGATPTGNRKQTLNSNSNNSNFSSNDGLQAKISAFIENLKDKNLNPETGSSSMLSIADKTFDAMQGAIARQKLADYPPDLILEIPRDACGTLEFERADEMITLGVETAASSFNRFES